MRAISAVSGKANKVAVQQAKFLSSVCSNAEVGSMRSPSKMPVQKRFCPSLRAKSDRIALSTRIASVPMTSSTCRTSTMCGSTTQNCLLKTETTSMASRTFGTRRNGICGATTVSPGITSTSISKSASGVSITGRRATY